VLDLGQQFHGGVGGRDPAGWAVLMDQGEAGPVDLEDGSGGLRDPEQPGQQVLGFGQGCPELLNGPGDHLTVNSHSLILVVVATTRECSRRRAARATRSGRRPGHPVLARSAPARPRHGPLVVPVAGWLSGGWSCLAQLLVGRDRTSLEGTGGPDPVVRSLQVDPGSTAMILG
jgi:hypothetical protein